MIFKEVCIFKTEQLNYCDGLSLSAKEMGFCSLEMFKSDPLFHVNMVFFFPFKFSHSNVVFQHSRLLLLFTGILTVMK